MAPAPKPPGQRVRRNKDQQHWKTLPSAARFKPPAAPSGWTASTKRWWKLIWGSPMASMWLESDTHALLRLGHLLDLQAKGKISAIMVGEIRQIEDRFGLSPKSRRSLMWHVPVDGAEEDDDQPEQTRGKVRHLKAV